MTDEVIIEATEDAVQRQYVYIEKVKEITAEQTSREGRQPTYDVQFLAAR